MNRFKIGQKVIVVGPKLGEDPYRAEDDEGHSNSWVPPMNKYIGKIFTIRHIGPGGYRLKDGPKDYGFLSHWLNKI